MSLSPPVSVIVVSRGRPDALRRCLMGIEQLDYDRIEVVVVADELGRDSVSALGWDERVKLVPFEEPNISAARNAGLGVAAGQVVAFIDDDAVPEPTWLRALAAPFSERAVAAAGGFVRGRNGISFQWKARSLHNTGEAFPLEVDPIQTTVLTGQPGRAIKTEGTNMAFRRDVLAAIGGFDPAFRFYHDEADVNMRLAERGSATAIVPLAEVHHGFMASERRRSDRVPLSLFEVGASTMVFLRKHCGGGEQAPIARLLAERRKALTEQMVKGLIEPRDLRRIMASLKKGLKEGETRTLSSLKPIPSSTELFHGFETFPQRATESLSGRPLAAKKLRKMADAHIAERKRVTLFLFSRTALFHRVTFTEAGIWEHTGGIFGRSERNNPLIRLSTFKARVRREMQRISLQRGLSARN